MHLFAACTRLLLLTDAFIDSSTLRGGTLSVWYSWTVGTIPKEHIQMKDEDWEINVWIESAVIYPHPDMWYVISNQNVGLLPAPLGHWAVHCTRKGGGASVFHTSSINYAQSQWEAACCCQWSAVTSTTPAQHQAALHRWQGGWYECMQWWLWSLSPIKLLKCVWGNLYEAEIKLTTQEVYSVFTSTQTTQLSSALLH